jgi:hypothetical protein
MEDFARVTLELLQLPFRLVLAQRLGGLKAFQTKPLTRFRIPLQCMVIHATHGLAIKISPI